MTSKTPYHKKIHHKIKPKFHQTHFIKKWPKGFPIHKKWISQFFYLLHGVVVHEEKSLLTKEDMFKANLILRKGDFILTGNLHELTSIIIGGAVTHAALYIGHRTFIQATGKGVHFATLHHIFSNHDTFTILRLPKHVKNKNEIIRKAIQFGHKQIGKSYDYFFTESEEKFFCSELVNSCFHHAGYKTGLRSVKPAHSFIEKAEKDSGIKAIIFDINSPGGSPVASSEIANTIKSLNKPTLSVISDIGASGAYWIASSTDKIFANQMSIVGSIGVIASYLEFAEFIDDHNVTYRRLVSGKYKDIGSMFKEMTPEEETQMQAIIDKMHQYFIEEVAINRNLSIEHVSELANGMFYLGEESKELELIDYIGNLPSAKEYLEKELNITIELTTYEKEKSLRDMFNIMSNEKFFYIGQGISKNILEKDFSITT